MINEKIMKLIHKQVVKRNEPYSYYYKENHNLVIVETIAQYQHGDKVRINSDGARTFDLIEGQVLTIDKPSFLDNYWHVLEYPNFTIDVSEIELITSNEIVNVLVAKPLPKGFNEALEHITKIPDDIPF